MSEEEEFGGLVDRRGEPDLSTLSDAGLRRLAERVDLELERRRQLRLRDEQARGGLLEGEGPRYRNPDNPAETWSGRGPQPAWVSRLRASGVRLDALRVRDDGPGPGRGSRGPRR